MNAAIQEAIRVIGPSDDDDYVLTPSEHADRYRDASPELAKLLESSAVRVIAERYERLDERALELQGAFEGTSSRARNAVFWTGVSSAVLLAGGGLSGVIAPTVRILLTSVAGAGAVVTGALARMWIKRIKEGRLLERWMAARADAETERLRYFESITAGTDSVDPILLLEYFRRFQLDVQRAYYRNRGVDHRRAADRALNRGSIAVAGGAAASGLAGVLSVFQPAWTALAAVGLTGQAWASTVTNEEATAQSRRNAERYDRTGVTLDRIYERLDEVRTAVAGGDTAVLSEFVETVHEQLSLEHRQWQEEMHVAGTAIGRLEQLLSKHADDVGIPGQDAPAGE